MNHPVYLFGNWKMHKTRSEAMQFLSLFLPQIDQNAPGLGIAPPYTALETVSSALKNSSILCGAQNLSAQAQGAHTGEISASMLLDVGAQFVLIGHSERRHLYKESDELIAAKLKQAHEAGLKVVFCVGETEKQREKREIREVIYHQLAALTSLENTLIAYEPVWAIGTGKTATPQMVAEAHLVCKERLIERFGKAVPILYGGSVTAETTLSLLEQEEISGLLVGGAALNPDSFARIVNLARKVRQ